MSLKLKDFYLSQLPGIPGRTDQTRAGILDATIQIIAKQGLGGLSLASLTKETGLSKPRIAYHFDDLEKLVLEAYTWAGKFGQHLTISIFERSKSPEDKYMVIFDGAVAWSSSHSTLGAFFMTMSSASALNPWIRKVQTRIFDTGRERIEAILADTAVPREAIPSRALFLHGVAVGTVYRAIAMNQVDGLAQLRDEVLRTFQSITAS